MNSTGIGLADRQPKCRRIAVLGATGSIGTATIDVLNHLKQVDQNTDWHLWSASGHSRVDKLVKAVAACDPNPKQLIVSDLDSDTSAAIATRIPCNIGPEALVNAAIDQNVDTVVAAIVGRAGVESTLAAIKSNKRVALANKETLVVAGSIVDSMMKSSQAELLPVDSEHSAIFQCIEAAHAKSKKTDSDG